MQAVPVQAVPVEGVPEGVPGPPTARMRRPERLLQVPVHRRRRWTPPGRSLLRPVQATPQQQTTSKPKLAGGGAHGSPPAPSVAGEEALITLPTPRDYADVHTVHAVCPHCDRWQKLDLAALVAAGHGDVPLIKLKLRCSACGRTGHEIKVSGRSYGLAE